MFVCTHFEYYIRFLDVPTKPLTRKRVCVWGFMGNVICVCFRLCILTHVRRFSWISIHFRTFPTALYSRKRVFCVCRDSPADAAFVCVSSRFVVFPCVSLCLLLCFATLSHIRVVSLAFPTQLYDMFVHVDCVRTCLCVHILNIISDF